MKNKGNVINYRLSCAWDIITRDNVSVKVSAVVYFRVLDAIKAIVDDGFNQPFRELALPDQFELFQKRDDAQNEQR